MAIAILELATLLAKTVMIGTVKCRAIVEMEDRRHHLGYR